MPRSKLGAIDPMGRGKSKKPINERFLSKVNKNGPLILETRCWIWARGSYGRFWNGESLVGAHRFSYELHKGPIPSGLDVCHRCDVSSCVNPEHLFVGTRLENIRDCVRKGRHQHGETGNSAKLTEAQVLDIRSRLDRKVSGARLARDFKVSESSISLIKMRINWKHI